MINRRYKVRKKLGQGRSSVYLCEDLELANKNFAIKILSATSSIEEQKIFKDEFQTIQNLDHPNIIQAYEHGTIVEVSENESISPGSKYLAMEYFDGNELLTYEPDEENILKEIITQICSVLFYLHQSNYVYYDLKPENILVRKINGKPFIKLIDLGFARSRKKENNIVTGTAEYLAPEILKKEPHDHRVDLYSFGILIYQLIYKKFPFQSHNQLEIYKEHIEKDFDFPETKYSANIISVVKKLLSKNPDERYFNSIQVLYELDIPINKDLYKNWVPIKVFTDRSDILNIVNRYVTTPSLGEIIVIRGFEKSGKSAVSRELQSRYENFILLNNDRTKSGIHLIKFFLNKLIFNEFAFHKMPLDVLELAGKVFSNQSSNIVNDLKLIVNKVTQQSKFILLLDDFNLYDDFSFEIFKEIFPVFQVNGCNVILTEKSDLDYVTGFINNLIELNLSSFTTVQTEELLENTYAEFFPVKAVNQLIMHYADFLPGNIIEFLKDIVLLKIIRFDYDGIKVQSDENYDETLKNLYQEIYNIRYRALTEEEIKTAELIASFEILPETQELIQVTGLSEEKFSKLVEELQRKDIFLSQSQSTPIFSSDGIKNFIYSQIPDKKKHHEKIAKTIRIISPQFSKVELARHYQICEKIDESYSLLLSEAEDAEKITALKYKQNILEQLIKLSLNKKQALNVKFKLCALYHILNSNKNAYDLSEELLKEKLSDAEKNELLIIKGNSLIRLGEVEEGKGELKTVLPSIKEESMKIKVMLDIAWGEFEINNYEDASNIGKIVLNNSKAQPEYKGDSYNLLGSIDFFQNHDLNSAQNNFEKCLYEYETAGAINRMAAIEINIGNIYNIKGDSDNAKKHWNRSHEISFSTGNLYQQGKVSLNLGVFYYNESNFEAAIDYYEKAEIIFRSLGDRHSLGLAMSNLGDAYSVICEYQKAVEFLERSREIFHEIQNNLEESESLFLLGKLYYKVGHFSKLDIIIRELESIVESGNITTRINLHLSLLKSFQKFVLHSETEHEILINTAKAYLSQEEPINFFETMGLLAENNLTKRESVDVLELLMDEYLRKLCTSNLHFEVERLYLMGKCLSGISVPNFESSIYYYNKAFNLMNDLHTNETMGKIIFELSKCHLDRGNVLKAKEYASYGRSLINLMADQLEDERTKDIYLNSSYRKIAWEKFTEIINFV